MICVGWDRSPRKLPGRASTHYTAAPNAVAPGTLERLITSAIAGCVGIPARVCLLWYSIFTLLSWATENVFSPIPSYLRTGKTPEPLAVERQKVPAQVVGESDALLRSRGPVLYLVFLLSNLFSGCSLHREQ